MSHIMRTYKNQTIAFAPEGEKQTASLAVNTGTTMRRLNA